MCQVVRRNSVYQNIQKLSLNFYLYIIDKIYQMWYTVFMNTQMTEKNLVVTGLKDFNLKHIFDCGQCFRWNADADGSYTGVAHGRALRIKQSGDTVTFYDTSEKDFENIWRGYFDLDRDYGEIKKKLASDDVMRKAVEYGGGIRILNQDLWETVVSFIISASNNIPRIKGIIERLCALCGSEIEYGGEIYYSFPDCETLALLSSEDLAPIRAGFRDKYIIDAARRFASGDIDETYIRSLDAEGAKKELMRINGVGNKVANCILLFGLSHKEAFPVDVWIKRIMEYCYFDGETSINAVSEFAQKKFGALGGFAQQYLFFYAREEKIGL